MKRPTLRRKTFNENNIVRAICDYLVLRKHMFWRQNTAPAVQKNKDGWQFRRMPAYAKRGVPDIIVIKPGGLFVGLEVKTDTGKLSKDQEIFSNDVQDVSGEYFVVRSIDDVQRIGL